MSSLYIFRWMERMLKKELAPISEFETQLQYGVTLAELARLFSEESVKKIFEVIIQEIILFIVKYINITIILKKKKKKIKYISIYV